MSIAGPWDQTDPMGLAERTPPTRTHLRATIFYLVVCVVASGLCVFVFWSWISDDTSTAALRTQRALPFIALSGLALAIPFSRQLRERKRMTDALLRANKAMSSIARLTATGMQPRPTRDVLDELLHLGLEALNGDAGAIYVSDAPDKPLRRAAFMGDGFPRVVERGSAGGLVGDVVANGRTLTFDADLETDVDQQRLDGLPNTCGSWVAMPLLHGREPVGVVLFGFNEAGAGDEDDQRIMEVVANRASAVLRTAAIAESGRRSRLGADHARRQLAMLAEGSKALVAGLDDYDVGLQHLAAVVVPDFADWCAIDLVEEGEMRRITSQHVDREAHPHDTGDPALDWRDVSRRVMATGRSALEWDRGDPGKSVPMIAPRLNSYVAVPIRLHGLSVGCISCGTAPPRRGFRASDLHAVEELASRVATALERVSLYRATELSAADAADRAAQLRRIMEAAVAIHAEHGVQPTAEIVAAQARRVLFAERAMVFVPGENRDAIRVVLSGDRSPEALDDVDEEVLAALSKPSASGTHIGRVIDEVGGQVTALVARLTDGVGRPLGVLAVSDKEVGAFTEDDEWSLVSLAQFASIALDNAHLYDTLRAGEDRLRALIDASPVAIIEFDLDSRARLWNHAATSLLGEEIADDAGRSLQFHVDTEKLFHRIVEDVMQSGPVPLIEDQAWRVDGTEMPVSIVAAPLRTALGDLHGVLVLANDVTDRRVLEEQLARAQRLEAVGQVAGGVAHDFNNLLTVILGHTELLEYELGADHPNLDDVGAVRSAAERAASVTSQLLTISRGDLVATEVFDPRARLRTVQETVERFLPLGVDLVVSLDDCPTYLRMAPAQFDQLILNLALNAKDAMKGGGTLSVTLDECDHLIRLRVTDTGEGMSPETAARCFEPFFTTKGSARGTGLGLATVYSVVTGAGGTITVDTAPGRGTSFTMQFPAAVGEAPVTAAEHRPVTRGSGRILLAEDEDGLRQLASEVLRGAGYIVAPVPDGQAAIELLDATQELPDLLVTDVVMPRMNGVELARQLRLRNPDIPVLFVSGYAESATRDDLRGAEVLIKPFLLRELTAKVQEVLERAQSSAKELDQGSKR